MRKKIKTFKRQKNRTGRIHYPSRWKDEKQKLEGM